MDNKISYFIIGAQKAGTSSLVKYLSQHPKISTHKGNEFGYFVNDEINSTIPISEFIKEYYDISSDKETNLIAKNVGVMYSEDALRKLHEHNPDMKIILVLRDPVERAYSAYWYARKKMFEDENVSFEQAIKLGNERYKNDYIRYSHCDYLGRSTYSNTLKIILKIFKKENVFVCAFEEFAKNPGNVCNKIFSFLSLSNYNVDTSVIINKRAVNKYKFVENVLKSPPVFLKKIIYFFFKKAQIREFTYRLRNFNSKEIRTEKINSETKVQLSKYFEPYNAELKSMVSINIDSWGK